MALRRCDSCRDSYDAKRPSSRFCSERCRKRAQRGHVAPPAAPVLILAVEDGQAGLRAATLADLSAVGRQETSAGVAALVLAARIDSGQDTGSGIASLARQWQALMVHALDGAKSSSRPDELRAKRAARRSD